VSTNANFGETADTGVESSAVIDATNLAANQFFTYNGEEGISRTTDRFILGDAQVNGGNQIDGGAVDTDSTTFAGNADFLEIRGPAVVTASAGDLTGMRNIGNIELTDNGTLPITTTLELNNAAVDALVDSFHTASSTQVERLNVGTTGVGNLNIHVRLDAGNLSNAFALNVNTSLTSGNDTLTTGAGNDTIAAGAGNDSVTSGAGDDTVDAGAGNDTVFGQGGNDSILGGAGADNIVADDNADNGNDTVLGDAGDDTIFGGDGNDSLDGGADNDILSGGDGNDTVLGNTGNDVLGGGAGNDSLDGGDGNDILVAEAGTDTVLGGIGNDTIIGADSTDSIDGGAGIDELRLTTSYAPTADANLANVENIVMLGAAATNVNLGNQTDTFTVTMTNNGDAVTTGTGADTITGGTGNDSITSGTGADTVNGGGGIDTINLGGAADAAVLDNVLYSLDADANGVANGSGVFAATSGDDINGFFQGSDDVRFSGAFASVNMVGTTVDAAVAYAAALDLDGAAGRSTIFVFNSAASTTEAHLLDFSIFKDAFAAGADFANEAVADERIFAINNDGIAGAGHATALYKFTSATADNEITVNELRFIGMVDSDVDFNVFNFF
jgi:Ca2+-binding RTX toxin-like protein